MAKIENKDLREDETVSEAKANEVKGGIALLLPAVQSAREAARKKAKTASVESVFAYKKR